MAVEQYTARFEKFVRACRQSSRKIDNLDHALPRRPARAMALSTHCNGISQHSRTVRYAYGRFVATGRANVRLSVFHLPLRAKRGLTIRTHKRTTGLTNCAQSHGLNRSQRLPAHCNHILVRYADAIYKNQAR